MKIGIDAREFRAGRMTGIGRYLYHFLRYAVLSDRPHEYVLFCNQHTRVPLESTKIKNVIIPEKITQVWDQVHLPNNIKGEGIDVFLTPYFKVPLFLSCKMVAIINDTIPLFFPEEHGFFRRTYFKFWCGLAVRRAAKIVTISANSRYDIVKFFKVPSEKIKVVYLGAEEKQEYSSEEEVRNKYTLPPKFILYVGSLSPHKNARGLIEAYAVLPEGLKGEYKLVLAARKDKRYLGGIERAIEKAGVSRDVSFTGFIDDEDLPAVYRMSSLFAFPSLYEGFGLPPLEAMACGVPVVSSNASSMPEVLGDAAILADPENIPGFAGEMERVLTDGTLRKLMIEKGLGRAKAFTVVKMAKEFLQVLEDCGQG